MLGKSVPQKDNLAGMEKIVTIKLAAFARHCAG
jgi:hypothetical protein